MMPEEVRDRLAALGCVAPSAEAAVLLADGPDDQLVEARLARRADGEPLAWIVGWADVAGARVEVDVGVYVPRPQTAGLVRRAIDLVPDGGRLVDVCCGSGAIAAAVRAARPDARVVGVDVEELAGRCALRNRVPAVVADARSLPLAPRSADVVTAVAPYVPTGAMAMLSADVVRHEPSAALDGGHDGLTLVRAVVATAAPLLCPGGWLLLEVGGDQDRLLAADLAELGYVDVTTWPDDEGDLRGLAARRP